MASDRPARPVSNPWRDIPLADYEAHMALPAIGQAEMLAATFETVLREFLPASVAVVGCAGGNGFDRVRTDVTTRVVAADINREYVETVSERYAQRIPGLELLVADVQASPLDCAPVDLLFAALVLEFVSPERALPHLRAVCRPNGVLVVVLQLPSVLWQVVFCEHLPDHDWRGAVRAGRRAMTVAPRCAAGDRMSAEGRGFHDRSL